VDRRKSFLRLVEEPAAWLNLQITGSTPARSEREFEPLVRSSQKARRSTEGAVFAREVRKGVHAEVEKEKRKWTSLAKTIFHQDDDIMFAFQDWESFDVDVQRRN
jgi:hypothetical protein